ncbi:PH domain-containing protein [Dyadobacter sandarakinus]|uniref:Bacterial Pleckstrin homology domain-containing protein n=1 Tax=Dyadobacter sandarakinus TaxID=2747268 RepID=A0ABX7I1B2_9BACT|nr:PH domain-containing protein [Dyadobacter sandarakinus]QRQ99853.1 hypothetical protein HWI92_02435 [Dyadobacter sandarakinus]
MMMHQENSTVYSASLDKMAKWVTAGVTLLFLFIVLSPLFTDQNGGWGTAVVSGVLLWSIYLVCYGLRPAGYVIQSDRLTIRRPFKNAVILRSQIREVHLLDDEALKWSIRTFAVGGLFGYFGKFANTKLGSMTWYATRRTRAVLIRTVNDKKIIVTPDNAGDFVRRLGE